MTNKTLDEIQEALEQGDTLIASVPSPGIDGKVRYRAKSKFTNDIKKSLDKEKKLLAFILGYIIFCVVVSIALILKVIISEQQVVFEAAYLVIMLGCGLWGVVLRKRSIARIDRLTNLEKELRKTLKNLEVIESEQQKRQC